MKKKIASTYLVKFGFARRSLLAVVGVEARLGVGGRLEARSVTYFGGRLEARSVTNFGGRLEARSVT